MKYINLKQIVRQTHEKELDKLSQDDYTDRFKKLYDHDSEHLREVLTAVNFFPDLLKENGEYKIPIEDGEFIQWILDNYTSDDMKHIRKGEYHRVDINFMFTLVNGLDTLLKHLDVEQEIRDVSHILVNQKTKYDEKVRLFNIQAEYMRLLHDITMLFEVPTFDLTYDDRMECLAQIDTLTEKYTDDARKIYSDVVKKREEIIRKNSYPITLEEIAFSDRKIQINNELYANEEFCMLQSELNEMKRNKGFLKHYEKERILRERRITEIFKEIASKYPIDVDNMTKLERIMVLAEDSFRIHIDGATKEAYVYFDTDVSWFDEHDTMIWA